MENVNLLLEPARAFLAQLGEFLPRLALAALVALGGWLLARLARVAIDKLLRAVNFNVLTERSGLDGFLAQGGLRLDTPAIVALLAFWLVLLAALIVAFNGLGLAAVTDLLGQVALFLPKLAVAVFILALGAYFARVVGNAVLAWCSGAGLQDAGFLARAAQVAILVFVSLIALDQVGVGGDIVRQSFLILFAGLVFALALAFGLGGRARAAELLERWLPQRPGGGTDPKP